MVEVAGHLLDSVLPQEPLRQYVCSLPFARRLAGYEAEVFMKLLRPQHIGSRAAAAQRAQASSAPKPGEIDGLAIGHFTADARRSNLRPRCEYREDE